MVTTLRMLPVAEAVSIPFVQQFLHDGRLQPNETLQQAAEAMLGELAAVADAVRPLRQRKQHAA